MDLNAAIQPLKVDDEEGTNEITVRRMLLNKCQEEFEQGTLAMRAVDAREKKASATEVPSYLVTTLPEFSLYSSPQHLASSPLMLIGMCTTQHAPCKGHARGMGLLHNKLLDVQTLHA